MSVTSQSRQTNLVPVRLYPYACLHTKPFTSTTNFVYISFVGGNLAFCGQKIGMTFSQTNFLVDFHSILIIVDWKMYEIMVTSEVAFRNCHAVFSRLSRVAILFATSKVLASGRVAHYVICNFITWSEQNKRCSEKKVVSDFKSFSKWEKQVPHTQISHYLSHMFPLKCDICTNRRQNNIKTKVAKCVHIWSIGCAWRYYNDTNVYMSSSLEERFAQMWPLLDL